MKRVAFLLIIAMICGCSFVMTKDQDMKTIGITKDDASKLNEDIDTQRPDAPREIRILQKDDVGQAEEGLVPETRPIK